jgi:hypothetical protein
MDENEIIKKLHKRIAISKFNEEENFKMKRNKLDIGKKVAIVVCSLVSITGVAFATKYFVNKFGTNSSDGVDIAVNNGYISNQKTSTQKADGIELNVESMLMDDDNFAMNFNMKLDDKYNIEEFKWIDFDDLKITDETGKIIFNSYQIGNEAIRNNEYEKIYKGAYSIFANEENEHNLTVSLIATGNPEKFPKSKHLTIEITKISAKVADNYDADKKTYEGNWKFEYDVPEEFYNRKTIIYSAIKSTDNSINLNTITATLSNTAFKITIPEITTDKINYDLLQTSTPKSIYDKIAIQKEYIETSDGKKFKPAGRSDGDGGYSIEKANTITNYHQTFNLTSFDATNNIKAHLFTNTGAEIVIEFEKE